MVQCNRSRLPRKAGWTGVREARTLHPDSDWNRREGGGLRMQLRGLECGQHTRVKWQSRACPPLFARLEEFTHHLQYIWEASRGSLDWPSQAHNKGNWALLTYKIRAAANLEVFHSDPSFTEGGNRARHREGTYTRAHRLEVENLGWDTRNFKSYRFGPLLSLKRHSLGSPTGLYVTFTTLPPWRVP